MDRINRIKTKDEGGTMNNGLKDKSFLLFIPRFALIIHRFSVSCLSCLSMLISSVFFGTLNYPADLWGRPSEMITE
jgi:hypothetical protein